MAESDLRKGLGNAIFNNTDMHILNEWEVFQMFRRLFMMMLLGLALSVPVQAAQDVYGPIGRNDTLWKIAETLRPTKKAATQQVIMAIYDKNKHAFTVNNISSLRKGAYILAPTEAEVLAISRKSAISMVQRHNTRWKKKRYVATRAPVPEELTKRLAEGSASLAEKSADKTTETVATKQTTTPTITESPEPTLVNEVVPKPVPEIITAGTPVQEQLRIMKQELQAAHKENQLLKDELAEAREQQKQSLAKAQKADPKIQAQLDALSYELKELRTILTQKDNHIQTLQASLKSASEAIKSQHADNMRLYNKLKELNPEGLPAQAKQAQGKPHIKLAAVNSDNQLDQPDQSAKIDDTTTAKIWADENNTGAMNPVNTASKPTNAVEADSGGGVSLSQLINGQQVGVGLAKAKEAGTTSRFYSVSPVAWAAVLLSLVFILFLVIRAFIVQNQIRQFEKDEY
ncbi:MAG: Unknown protein [uncultured Thiotrichaceae bacterium]|uniref:FimV N-terminal domain-containing protein n=1 Tax=uncultured Thiotrichaceae bacterium TaxID=298394 RepID=A0A6S6SXA3_9GAMM|nr:MAG: Unknown protein [uncultured Thiotrichaceae bacterium]